jgi:hypothetical protein
MDLIDFDILLYQEKQVVSNWIDTSYYNSNRIEELQHIYRCRFFTEEDKEFFYPILYRFCDKHNIEYKNKKILREAINENIFCDKSIFTDFMIHQAAYNPHIDHKEPNHTFILYLTDGTIPTLFWDRKQQPSDKGSMIPLEEGNQVTHKVYPKQFSMIHIDGGVYHSQELPEYNEKRIVVIMALEK